MTTMRSPRTSTLLSVEFLDDRNLPSGFPRGLSTSLGLGGLTASLGLQASLGGGSQTPTSPPPAAAPASLSGHVYYDDGSGTLHPISGVQISLQDSSGATVANATTDA